MGKINDLSTISGVISELSKIHTLEKYERAITLFNCSYALLKQSGEYASDFDDEYQNPDDKYAFDLATDTLCESFYNTSKRINRAIHSCH